MFKVLLPQAWRHLLILIVALTSVLFWSLAARAQTAEIDSLIKVSSQAGLSDIDRARLDISIGQKQNLYQNDQALKYLESAIKLGESAKEYSVVIKAHGELGRYYFDRGQNDLALKQFLVQENISKRHGDLTGIGGALKGQAIINFGEGLYELAIKQMEEAYATLSKTNDIENTAKTALNVGIFFTETSKPQVSVKYFKRAEVLFRSINSKFGVAKVYSCLASTYYNTGDFKTALHFVNLALASFKEQQLENEITGQLNLKSVILAKLGKFSEATAILEDNKVKIANIPDVAIVAEFYNAGAEVSGLAKDYSAQLNYAKSLKKVAKDSKQRRQLRLAYGFEAKALAGLGNFKDAFAAQESERILADSLNNEGIINRVHALDAYYQLKDKQHEIESLKNQTAVQESTLYSQKSQLLIFRILVIALIVVLVIAVWLYRKDLIARKKIEANELELIKRNEQLDSLNKSKNRLFRIMAHDLRGPLGSLMHLPTIYDRLFEARDLLGINEMNQVVFKTMKQLHNLMDSLLTWATAESGLVSIAPERIKVDQLFNTLTSLFGEQASQKQITLVANIKTVDELWADNNITYTVMRNLVNNALKFSYAENEVVLEANSDHDWIKLSVADFGRGMTKEVLDSLFVVGDIKKSVGTQGEKGTGLGLLIVKEMMALSKGYLRIESGFGQGTTISIWLPIKENARPLSYQPIEIIDILAKS